MADTNSVEKLKTNIDTYRYNPSGIKREIFNMLDEVSNGTINVVDPTNPFVFLLESATVATAAFMVENKRNNRRQYATAAQTEEDLYLHMSDKDYIDRFASPSSVKFGIVFDYEELISRMVLDPLTEIRKVTIPRNTEFKIIDTIFSLQYPIDIKLLAHSGIQVVYNSDELTPLQTLTTNLVPYREVKLVANQAKNLIIEVEASQFFIKTFRSDLTSSTGFSKHYPIEDEYYFARVFNKSDDTGNQWKELKTTHTDQVYDPLTPTAVLKVFDKSLQVKIPQIYFTNDTVSGSIRIDIYQTKGFLNQSLRNYKPSSLVINWKTIENTEITPEVAALISLNNVFAYAITDANGGKSAITFDQLRSRVIQNAIGDPSLPITNVQIQSALQNQGFEIVQKVDNITNRVFLATKLLPKPIDEKLITAGAASIETVMLSLQSVAQHPNVRNNGNRLTLTPELLYENENGVIRIVDFNTLSNILNQSAELIADAVSKKNYLYTAFHYVLDNSGTTFDVRPYYLNGPNIPSYQFIAHNDKTLLQVNTDSFNVSRSVYGYRLLVTTKSNRSYQQLDDSQVHVHLSFIGQSEQNRCYLKGRQIHKKENGERIFEFMINTNFDIDEDHNLILTSFQMFDNSPKRFLSKLKQDFDVYYSASSQMPGSWSSVQIDSELPGFDLPPRIAFINKEQATIEFGAFLNNLWCSFRSLPASAPYKTHQTDVYETYKEDVYSVDPVTSSIFSFAADGTIVYNLLHRKGDTVIDQRTQQPVIKYRKGDILLDINGLPTPTDPITVARQIDMLFIEGPYFFATDVSSKIYRDSITSTMMDWMTRDLERINRSLLEQTHIYFYPKTSMGKIDVVVQSNARTVIEAGQSLKVRLFVSSVVFENFALREALTKGTIRAIDEEFKKSTVTVSGITSHLLSVYGSDVLSVTVLNLGGEQNLEMFSILEESKRCSIRKKLVALPDNRLIVQEDITIEFIKH